MRVGLNAVGDGKGGFFNGIEVAIEADDGGGSLWSDVDPRDAQGVEGEDVAVGRARGWGGSAVAGSAVVCARLNAAGGHGGSEAGVGGNLRGGGGDVGDDPVPPAGAGGRIGIKTGENKTLCADGDAGPTELRRAIFSAMAEAVVDVGSRHNAAIG